MDLKFIDEPDIIDNEPHKITNNKLSQKHTIKFTNPVDKEIKKNNDIYCLARINVIEKASTKISKVIYYIDIEFEYGENKEASYLCNPLYPSKNICLAKDNNYVDFIEGNTYIIDKNLYTTYIIDLLLGKNKKKINENIYEQQLRHLVFNELKKLNEMSSYKNLFE